MYTYKNAFVATHYCLQSSKIQNPIRLVFFSDLHECEHGINNQELIQACRSFAADAILVPGDIVMDGYNLDNMRRLFSSLNNVYLSNGNHETRLRKNPYEYNKYLEEMQKTNVNILNNDSKHIVLNGNTVCITGLELDISQYKKKMLSEKEIEERVGKRGDGYQILLAHSPRYAPSYVKWGADLTLCGHYHGGVVRVFGRAVASPHYELFPKYGYGKYEKDGKTVLVTSGIGGHSVKFRLWNKMEIVVIDISAKQNNT